MDTLSEVDFPGASRDYLFGLGIDQLAFNILQFVRKLLDILLGVLLFLVCHVDFGISVSQDALGAEGRFGFDDWGWGFIRI